jgi:hypothetical protein
MGLGHSMTEAAVTARHRAAGGMSSRPLGRVRRHLPDLVCDTVRR